MIGRGEGNLGKLAHILFGGRRGGQVDDTDRIPHCAGVPFHLNQEVGCTVLSQTDILPFTATLLFLPYCLCLIKLILSHTHLEHTLLGKDSMPIAQRDTYDVVYVFKVIASIAVRQRYWTCILGPRMSGPENNCVPRTPYERRAR